MKEIDKKSNPRAISEDDFQALVYLRLFEGCNLHCDHCFIPSNPKRMTMDMISGVTNTMRKITKDDASVLLQWHGGEPTALGLTYLTEAVESIERTKGDLNITHSIQTNLLNYSSEWAPLYHKYFGSSVGVSWDYQIRKIRNSMSNKEYEDIFWDKLKQLVSDGLEPYFVVTGTRVFFERFKNPIELFEILESEGVYRLHIERLTEVGYARDNWDRIGVNNLEYSTYMSRFYRAYRLHLKNKQVNEEVKVIRMSPFDGLESSILDLLHGSPTVGYGCLSGACDTRFHTIDANGYKAGCTALTSEYDNKRVSSDVQVIRFFDLQEARVDRQLTCNGCEFKPICSSGCLALEKFDYSNECSGAKILFSEIKKFNALK